MWLKGREKRGKRSCIPKGVGSRLLPPRAKTTTSEVYNVYGMGCCMPVVDPPLSWRCVSLYASTTPVSSNMLSKNKPSYYLHQTHAHDKHKKIFSIRIIDTIDMQCFGVPSGEGGHKGSHVGLLSRWFRDKLLAVARTSGFSSSLLRRRNGQHNLWRNWVLTITIFAGRLFNWRMTHREREKSDAILASLRLNA